MPDRVPILGGTGALGFGLALRLARSGVPTAIGSRDAERAAAAAAGVRDQVPGADVEGLVNREAASRGPIVFLTVPYSAHSDTLASLSDVLREGQILVDTTVPLVREGQALGLAEPEGGSAGGYAQRTLAEGVHVVAALHTVGAPPLSDLEHELDEDVLVAGDSEEAKARVAELIRLIPGCRPVNAGKLRVAHFIEGLTPLLISINRRYKTHAGIRLTGLPDALW